MLGNQIKCDFCRCRTFFSTESAFERERTESWHGFPQVCFKQILIGIPPSPTHVNQQRRNGASKQTRTHASGKDVANQSSRINQQLRNGKSQQTAKLASGKSVTAACGRTCKMHLWTPTELHSFVRIGKRDCQAFCAPKILSKPLRGQLSGRHAGCIK